MILVSQRRGIKRRWSSTEMSAFNTFLARNIKEKRMATGRELLELQAIILTRTVPQLRTRLHNLINGKQKRQSVQQDTQDIV
jgi:predicted lysophospholipase L1 biosynthesis ABC-type transport system permease subunit